MKKIEKENISQNTSNGNYLMPAIIAITFILSRFYYIFVAGIAFNDSTAGSFIHILDPSWLTGDLLNSIFYMHSQPPLFNFFTGIILKLGTFSKFTFAFLYLTMGLAIPVLIYSISKNCGISKKISCALALFFILNPASVLYENILFYTYPMVFIMCATAKVYQIFTISLNLKYLHLFFWLAGTICLTRSLFHILWFAAAVILFIVLFKKNNISKKQILAGAAIPFVIVFSFYFKNYILFDRFTLSTWCGMNFAQIVIYGLAPEERKFLIETGCVSPAFEQVPFELSHDQIDYSKFKKTGAAAADEPAYNSGVTNFNNTAFIKISENYMNDSLKAVRYFPHAYVNGVFKAFCFYFLPAEEHFFHFDNFKKIEFIDRFWQRFICGRIEIKNWSQLYFNEYYFSNTAKIILNTPIFLLSACLLIIICSIITGFNKKKYDSGNEDIALKNKNMILFLLLNIIYVTLAGNLMECGENNRFRFMIDPYYIVLAGIYIDKALNRPHSKHKKK
ncbi:MAG: hypothetical protein QMC67_12270 [Candidatus Wallbacteria bacterium]